jgi:hypothetical protein
MYQPNSEKQKKRLELPKYKSLAGKEQRVPRF